jgi:hypothetical protein
VASCRAYVSTAGVLLARGGRRYRQCKRTATTTREHTQRTVAWERTETIALCGQHAKMFDRGDVRLSATERAR